MNCDVLFNHEKCGEIYLEEGIEFSFKYEESYLKKKGTTALSLSLPLRLEKFTYKECLGFFEGLLPEGDRRNELAMTLHISHGNIFELLKRIGGECAGAIQIIDPNSIDETIKQKRKSFLNEKELLSCLKSFETRKDYGYRRLSLAGAQFKCPMVVTIEKDKRKYRLPEIGEASTHIVKIGNEQFPHLVENEAYLLSIANRLGLTSLRPVVDRQFKEPLLVLERYDRMVTDSGEVTRIHQEDFCQALGLPSPVKYNQEGGPGAKELFSIVKKTTFRGPNMIKLLQYLLFQYLTGNDDGHAKNYSLLYNQGKVDLAPLYDTVCTRIYPLDQILQPSIGGQTNMMFLEKSHMDRFIEDIGFSKSIARKSIKSFIDAFSGVIENDSKISMPFNRKTVQAMKQIFKKQKQFLLNSL